MRTSTFLTGAIAFALTTTTTLAQAVIDPSKLPSCALKCQLLNQAQDACVPPAAPETDQGTYQSCYCQSAYLTPLYSTPSGICDECSASDQQKIQTWYRGLCTGGVVVTPAASNAQASNTASSGSAAASSASGSSAPSSSPSAGSSNQNSASNSGSDDSNKSWIAGHYGWVIFLIVIFMAIIAGFWGGIWLRRRHKRKVATARFSSQSHLAGAGAAAGASPMNSSGVLSGADGAYIGSRNHPNMTMVPDAGSQAAYERYEGYKGGAADSIHPAPSAAMRMGKAPHATVTSRF